MPRLKPVLRYDLYDTTCMTYNRCSNFYCVYTIMQVVHTEFIKVVLTEYSAFRSSSKIIQEQAAAAAATIGFLSTGVLYKRYVDEYYFSYSTMNSSTSTSFRPFVFSIFSSLITSLILLLSTKTFYEKTNYLI